MKSQSTLITRLALLSLIFVSSYISTDTISADLIPLCSQRNTLGHGVRCVNNHKPGASACEIELSTLRHCGFSAEENACVCFLDELETSYLR